MEVRTVQRPRCPVCSGQGDILYRDQEDSLFGAPGKWNLRKCLNSQCAELCWLDPIPIEADMIYLYQDYPTHGRKSALPGLKSKVRDVLVKIYDTAKLLPLSVLGVAAERQQFSNMFLSDLPPGRVLDVGCGDGGFLYRMYLKGWSVVGLDFDKDAIEAAREQYGEFGLEFLQTDLTSARFSDNSFDAVTMNHVIEHVSQPTELLAEVRRVLKPGGRLVSITPNIQSWAHSLFKECWRGLEIPRHLQIFSLPALEVCARKASFSKVDVKSSAAHADVIFGASIAIKEAHQSGSKLTVGSEIDFLRAIRSSILQYREAIRCRSHLICHK